MSSLNAHKTQSEYIEQVNVDIRREKTAKHHKTAQWVEIVLDIAFKHPQGADVWGGNRATITEAITKK